MRLLEICIVMLGKDSEVTGDCPEVYTRAVVDLDRASSCFDTADGHIKLFVSGEDGDYKTNSFTLDEFIPLWKGEAVAAPDPVPSEIDRLINGEL